MWRSSVVQPELPGRLWLQWEQGCVQECGDKPSPGLAAPPSPAVTPLQMGHWELVRVQPELQRGRPDPQRLLQEENLCQRGENPG